MGPAMGRSLNKKSIFRRKNKKSKNKNKRNRRVIKNLRLVAYES